MPTKYPPHGALNDIRIPDVGERLDLEDISAKELMRDVSNQLYKPNAVSNTGQYRAVVLRVETDTKPEIASWYSQIMGDFFPQPDKAPVLQKIKARIPEIHAGLPIPRTIGDDSIEHGVIDMYPTFTAKNDQLGKPSPGDIVWVDFGDKVNMADPVFTGHVIQSNKTSIQNKVNSAVVHQNACAGTFKSKAPKGDILAGSNKALAHAGLPMRPRSSAKSVSKNFTFLKGHRFTATTYNKWQTAIQAKGVPGITWFGNLPGNGEIDSQHTSGKRDTLIFAPNTTEFSSPVELIYFFHGLGEFGNNHDFNIRFPKAIKSLSESKRNFVLIIPELPWTVNGKTPRGRQSTAWTGKDNFALFHSNIEKAIKSSFSSNVLTVGLITVVGHSAGGGAIRTASKRGFETVKPQKIVFSDGDYGSYVQNTWDSYVKKNPTVEFNILTKPRGTPFKKAKLFLAKTKSSNIFAKTINKSHRQIGDMSLLFVNPNEKTQKDDKAKKAITDAKKIGNPDPDDEEDKSKNITEKHPKTPDPKLPAPQNAKTAPSAVAKQNVGKPKLPSSATIKKAEPFKEARVYVRDYGTLPANSNLLVNIPSVGSQKKLHKLAAKRFFAMNKAWMAETGESSIKVASAWRKHRWKSRQHYEDVIVKKYLGQTRTVRGQRITADTREKAIALGKRLIAFSSPHETGLAFDIGNHGLRPVSATIPQQKQTKLYKWLVANSHRFGIFPYINEPWHFESRLPKESWATGQEFTDNLAVTVVNVGTASGKKGVTTPTRLASAPKSCVQTVGNVA